MFPCIVFCPSFFTSRGYELWLWHLWLCGTGIACQSVDSRAQWWKLSVLAMMSLASYLVLGATLEPKIKSKICEGVMWISVRCLRQHTQPCQWRWGIMASQPYPWRRGVPDHRARYMNGCAFSAPMQASTCRHTQMRQRLWWHTWLPSRICQSAMVGMPGVSMMKNLDESVPCRPSYWTVFISYHRATLYTACVLGGHFCYRCPKKTRNSHTAVVQQTPRGTAHRTTESDAAPARGWCRSALATATWHDDTSAKTTAGAL